jgi:glutathione S-transferase
MLTLYGSSASRAHRVAWMLKELSLPYTAVNTNFQDGSTQHPEFLRINPNGRVPALDDDGFRLFESMAINLYLAKKYPSTLSAADSREDALAIQWSFWVVTEIEKPLLLAAANLFLFAPEARNLDEYRVAIKKLDRPWKVLDAHLAEREYLLGARFTVADLNVAAIMDLAYPAGLSLAAYPKLDAWLTACLNRPAADDWRGVKFTIPRPPTPLATLGMFV